LATAKVFGLLTVDKPTVIVTDQASIHTSDAIFDKSEEWKERNITIFVLKYRQLMLKR